jgi:5-methyltetrahydropteroyltriglutamate--homocysteine methyltransferase
VSDGLLSWQDLFRPIVDATDGLEATTLVRHFDNNTFFKEPTIRGELSPRALAHPHVHLPQASSVTLPSPFWFAKVAKDERLRDERERALALARDLNAHARALVAAGATYVQFEEPWAVFGRGASADERKLLAEAIAVAREGLRVPVGVYTYFGNGAGVAPTLLDAKVDVGFDFTATSIEDLADLDFAGKTLLAGVVDGRGSRVERADELAAFVRQALDELSPKHLALTNSCELELVPEVIARSKIAALGEAIREGF